MHRGWQDDPLFKGEPYSRRDAWEWLIANAAYEQHFQWFNGHRHSVERGQIVLSLASAAKAWKWTVQRVRTFFDQLETDEKVVRQATRSVTQLTICNYEKYQAKQHSEQPDSNKEPTQEQHTTEEGKENKKEESMPDKSGAYAFFGQTIKLTPRHLAEWKRQFFSILDVEAELSVLDAYWQTLPEDERKNWFLATKGMLNKKHQRNLAAEKEAEAPAAWDGMA